MKKVIKKKTVIEAIKKERRLKPGSFFHCETSFSQPGLKCPVCVVGAVLRKVGFEKWARQNYLPLNWVAMVFVCNNSCFGENPITLCANKNYLGALSCYHESGHTREECISFVKKYFPSQFLLEVPDIS